MRRLTGHIATAAVARAVTISLVAAAAATVPAIAVPSTPVTAAPPPETVFTLAQIPDTQNEVVADGNPLMPSRYQWLVDNRDALNLRFMVHSGDVVNWGVVDPIQFTRASAATDILDASGIPYAYAIGNHDTAAVTVGGSAGPGNVFVNLRNTTAFNQTFPVSRFKNVAGVFEAGKVDNMFQTFSAGNVDWLVITHEMWPRQSVVDWMKQVAEAHPNHNIIVNTHAYVNQSGQFQTTGIYGDLTAQQVWDQFISQYPNIKFVLSAHYGSNSTQVGASYTQRTGVHGNTVLQIMTAYHSNYQNHVRLLRIDTAGGSVSSTVFVPTSTTSDLPAGRVTDAHSDFLATGMNWVLPDGGTPPAPPETSTPSAPYGVTAVAGTGSARVAFVPPVWNGGSPLSYRVVASPGGATRPAAHRRSTSTGSAAARPTRLR